MKKKLGVQVLSVRSIVFYNIYILHVQEHGKTALVLHQDTSEINASIYYRNQNKPFL